MGRGGEKCSPAKWFSPAAAFFGGYGGGPAAPCFGGNPMALAFPGFLAGLHQGPRHARPFAYAAESGS
jgi:hypothetical protein